MNWPTRLTVTRLALVPIFALTLLSNATNGAVAATVVLATAGATDVLDGYLARRRGEESVTGRLLDPLADKLVVLSGVAMLAASGRLEWWLALVLLCKEVFQIGGAVAFWLTRRRMLASSALGKLASVLLYFGMFMAIWGLGAAKYLVGAGIAVSIAAGLSYSARALNQQAGGV